MELDKKEALELLKLMVTTNTVNPPGNEIVLAKKLQPLLEKEGLEVVIDEFMPGRANMVVTLPGADRSKKKLFFSGHLDTVPVGEVKWEHDPFAFEEKDGKIWGRGIADMKSGDAAALYSMVLLKRAGIVPKQDVVMAMTAGEETLSLGATDFVKKDGMATAGALVVCEPSGLKAYIAHRGAIWVKVEFFGKTSHGSMPELGVNAVLHMYKFIHQIMQQRFTCAQDEILGMPSMSINKAIGGTATNVVPDYAYCEIDFRTIPGQTWADIKAFLDQALTKAAEGEADFRYQYAYMGKELPPMKCPENCKLPDALDAAAGHKLVREGVRFFTDASILVTTPDLPVVVIGPGESNQAHQPNEHIVAEQYYEAIRLYYNLMKDYEV